MLAAVALAERRWIDRAGRRGDVPALAVWAVPAGLIGVRLFALYVAGHAVGRFWIERRRIDFAHTIAGLRVNEWTSIVLFVGAVAVLITRGRPALGGTEVEAGASNEGATTSGDTSRTE